MTTHHPLLDAPVTRTILRLSAPNVAALVAVTLTVGYDGYLIGKLGADALAGVSLVLPLAMLMMQMSAAGIGGGAASSIARALGAGRHQDAETLAMHALVLAVVVGLLAGAAALLFGPMLYRMLGGRGAALELAEAYALPILGCTVAPWVLNTAGAIYRGTGNMKMPALSMIACGLGHVLLGPLLVFGWGPVPAFGVTGAGLSLIFLYTVAGIVMLFLLTRPDAPLRLRKQRLHWRVFKALLAAGAPAAVSPLLSNMCVIVLTGYAGVFGTAALAGYGIGTRLEYILIQLAFGVGSTLLTLVGMNAGAGRFDQAKLTAWIGSLLVAAMTGSVGVLVAIWPEAWTGFFTGNPAVRDAGIDYLKIVGPFYSLFGFGLAMFFASQGAGRLRWPLTASALRLCCVVFAGAAVAQAAGGSLAGLAWVVGASFSVYAIVIGAAVRLAAWTSR
jgi:putative MATE family efflux protein